MDGRMAFVESSVDCAGGSRIKNVALVLDKVDKVKGFTIFNTFVIFALFAILSDHDPWNQLQGKLGTSAENQRTE
jgi:hypothetical protein